MVNSIKDLIVALICVAMLGVAAKAETAATTDLPVAGGRQTGVQPSLQQPASTFVSSEEAPLKGGGFAPPAVQPVARVQEMPEFGTTVVYLDKMPLLSVAGGEAALTRASAISARVNQLLWDSTAGSEIQVVYDGKTYAVAAGKQRTIVTMDAAIRLGRDSGLSPRAAALQVANRLRRHFGGAAPLNEVAGDSSLLQNISGSISGSVAGVFHGLASWYGETFLNRRTSSGQILRSDSMIAAHRALPFGTRLRVTNLNNGRQVTVRVQDRGPFIRGRVIDLSPRAAHVLGMVSSGIVRVKVEVIR